jgi:hypothetical protein
MIIMEKDIKYPGLYLIEQNFENNSELNIKQVLDAELQRTKLLTKIKPGQKVLITVGSRGIKCIPALTSSLVQAIKDLGAAPLILPAMGSHGGGTPSGQIDVLNHLGLTEGVLGAPIHKGLESVQVGEARGCPVYADRVVFESDHVILVNRIKEHTEFIGNIESGLIKMAVVGLGRFSGAESMHRLAVQSTYENAIKEMGRVLFDKLAILGGIGILEDMKNVTVKIEAIPAKEVFVREAELLKEAKQYHAQLPFDQMDILLVDEIGKDISGAGFDTKVIGRIRNIYEKECEWPKITRIVLRDLSNRTGGNALGIGLADYVHQRVVKKMDLEMTAINCITAVAPEKARIPITLPSDRKALEAAFSSIGPWEPDSVRMAWIINTAELECLAVSPALSEEARRQGLVVSSDSFSFRFDINGNLVGLKDIVDDKRA